jgi:hypothetical protein
MGYQDHKLFIASERPPREVGDFASGGATLKNTHSVTICSCIPFGTELEQIRAKREAMMLWAKDAVAGVGLVLFMAGAFLLTGSAQSLLSAV